MNLYHYCSNDSFVEIVKSRSIWLSELTLSSDYLEGKWIREVFRKVCEGLDVSELIIEQLLDQLDITINFWRGLGFCMSGRPDVLSQWRGYAEDGTGVSIGFPKDYLTQIKDQLSEDGVFGAIGLAEITYDLEKQKEGILPIVKLIMDYVERGALDRQGGTLFIAGEPNDKKERREKARKDLRQAFASFFLLLFSLKNTAFKEELESRLLTWIPQTGADGDDLTYLTKLQTRARGNHIVPYLELQLLEIELAAIDEVWLGPGNTTPEIIVNDFMVKHGFPNVKVRRSSASYRR